MVPFSVCKCHFKRFWKPVGISHCFFAEAHVVKCGSVRAGALNEENFCESDY